MKDIDVIYKGEVLKLTRFWGNDKLCLWIKDPKQIKMPKMEFVGGYPNEYCIFLEKLSSEELKEIKTIDGKVLNFEEGKRIQILSPIIRDEKGEHKKTLENIQKMGFVRAIIDGEQKDLSFDEISLIFIYSVSYFIGSKLICSILTFVPSFTLYPFW